MDASYMAEILGVWAMISLATHPLLQVTLARNKALVLQYPGRVARYACDSSKSGDVFYSSPQVPDSSFFFCDVG